MWLGERATERNLKALSRQASSRATRCCTLPPRRTRWQLLKAKAEPALILTPPKDCATIAELEEDDGLLTASEVGQLELDADWVVLSACNTAAGDVAMPRPSQLSERSANVREDHMCTARSWH